MIQFIQVSSESQHEQNIDDDLTELASAEIKHMHRQLLKDAENIWDIHKTEKNKNTSFIDCINWQQKLSKQNLNAPYLILYNSSAKDANATIVKGENWI